MEAEYTQKDLADRIGCGQSRVSQYERKAPLQMATLLKIADALEVELPLLLCVTDPQWREQFGWDNEGTEVRYANVG
jgi:transcriptional regulator with XRE-family HTH domain